ncbi:MAG TPA: hypothetical protein VHG93_18390 [Longimicrobium sp.]|nr:hypothetical protein [Longimicrobium sp.]
MANESNDLTRRDFAKVAVAAAVAPALGACASTVPGTASAPAPGVTSPGPTAAAQTPAAARQEPTPLARVLMDAIRVQYGDRMTEEEMARVQRSISGVLSTAERLRRFPLPIAAEPAFVYRVPGGAA